MEEIRQAATGNSKATNKQLYRSRVKQYPKFSTFEALRNKANRKMWFTLFGATTNADNPRFEERAMIYCDDQLAVFSSPELLRLLKVLINLLAHTQIYKKHYLAIPHNCIRWNIQISTKRNISNISNIWLCSNTINPGRNCINEKQNSSILQSLVSR